MSNGPANQGNAWRNIWLIVRRRTNDHTSQQRYDASHFSQSQNSHSRSSQGLLNSLQLLLSSDPQRDGNRVLWLTDRRVLNRSCLQDLERKSRHRRGTTRLFAVSEEGQCARIPGAVKSMEDESAPVSVLTTGNSGRGHMSMPWYPVVYSSAGTDDTGTNK